MMAKPSSDDADQGGSKTPPLGLGDQETALRLRDAVRTLVKNELDSARPPSRTYIVSSVQYATRQVTAYRPGDDADSSLPFAYYTDFTPTVGDVVLVEGPVTGGYITQIISRSRGVYPSSITNYPQRMQQAIKFSYPPFSPAIGVFCWQNVIEMVGMGQNDIGYGAVTIPQPLPGTAGNATHAVGHGTSAGTTDLTPFRTVYDAAGGTNASLTGINGVGLTMTTWDTLYWEFNVNSDTQYAAGIWHLVSFDALVPFDVPSHWVYIAGFTGSATGFKLGSGQSIRTTIPLSFNTAAGIDNYAIDFPAFELCTYELGNDGYVNLSGLAGNRSATTYPMPALIGTLPGGARPKRVLFFPVSTSNNTAGRLVINIDGRIELANMGDGGSLLAGGWVSLDGVRFRPYQ